MPHKCSRCLSLCSSSSSVFYPILPLQYLLVASLLVLRSSPPSPPHQMEYAVRGKVVITADSITSSLKTNPSAYPFSKIIYTNIGNPHSVGQKPLTWPRQVMALVDLPDDVGVDNPNVSKLFPQDAVERAKELKSYMGGCGTGAYSHSQGERAKKKNPSRLPVVSQSSRSNDNGTRRNQRHQRRSRGIHREEGRR